MTTNLDIIYTFELGTNTIIELARIKTITFEEIK
jgi:hypothetical protein